MEKTPTRSEKNKPKGRRVRMTDYYTNLLDQDESDLLPVMKPSEESAPKITGSPKPAEVTQTGSYTFTEPLKVEPPPTILEKLPVREEPTAIVSTKNEYELMAERALQKKRETELKLAEEEKARRDSSLRHAAESRGMSYDDLEAILKREVERRLRDEKRKSEIDTLEDGGMPIGGFDYHPYTDKTQYTLIPNQLFPLIFKEKAPLVKIVLKIYQMTLGFKMRGEDKATRREYVKLRHIDLEKSFAVSPRDIKPSIQEAMEKGYIGRKEVGGTFAYWIKFKGKPDPVIFDEPKKILN